MKRWSMVAVSAALVFAACADDNPSPPVGVGESADGGDSASASDDGGLGGDADAESPNRGGESATCINVMAGGGADGNSCNAEQTYTCGADSYRIDCSCPAATCTCEKNGVVVGSASYDSCPSCAMAFASAAEQCGIPSGGDIGVPGGPPGDE
jgi:hypothetical protein